MKRILILCSILLAGSAFADSTIEGVLCEVTVAQRDAIAGTNVTISQDTVEFLKGIRTSAYLHAFSAEVEVTATDSTSCTFSASILTLGPTNLNRSRQFTVEYGLPARLNDIGVKPDALYELKVTPIEAIAVDTAGCSYLTPSYTITPSANVDLYYIPGTMGDFFLPAVKSMIETVYDRAKTLFGFTLPGKYYLFLCPCQERSVIWDQRFGLSTNPLRSSAHVILTKEFNAADPFPIIHTALLRSWGQAPDPIVDGLASFYTLSLFDMKTMVPEKRYLPLDTLLFTSSYLRADPYEADRSAASFCEFLSRVYGIDKVEDIYLSSNDLTLKHEVERVCELPLAEVQGKWLAWIDTTTLAMNELANAADFSEAMFNYDRMLKLSQAMTKAAVTKTDSTRALERLTQATFAAGDYRQAVEIQKKLNNVELGASKNWTSLASFELMAGDDTATAFAAYRTAMQLDSGNGIPTFNMAYTIARMGDKNRAIDLLLPIALDARFTFPEANILLADLLRETKRKDKDPLKLYNDAISYLEKSLQTNKSTYLMGWIGRAYLGLGDTENALSYLWTAMTLETRPFYEGMIRLWLGNLMDQLGEHEAAREQYQLVIAKNSAAYHKAQAEQYLKTPYTLQ